MTTSSSITSEMLSPLIDGITANIGVIFPFALTIFGIFIGIKLVPNLINRFM